MIIAEFQCAYCGETNEISVDPDGGMNQVYNEDCQVCCRPNKLTVSWKDEEREDDRRTRFVDPKITAEAEADLEA